MSNGPSAFDELAKRAAGRTEVRLVDTRIDLRCRFCHRQVTTPIGAVSDANDDRLLRFLRGFINAHEACGLS